MSTEVPYAADAEISLTYDELEVKSLSHMPISRAKSKLLLIGTEAPIRKGVDFCTCLCAEQIQLCLGTSQEPTKRPPSRGCQVTSRQVVSSAERSRRRADIFISRDIQD